MLKRKPIKKKDRPVDAEEIKRMKEFFLSIWNKRLPHKCEECGANLGSTPHSYYFDHILEKQKHPALMYTEENIAYLCLWCHDKKTRGFYSETFKQKINHLKTKYNIL